MKRLTKVVATKQSARLGAGWWWGRVLDLRGSRESRLAHRVGAMHGDGDCCGGMTTESGSFFLLFCQMYSLRSMDGCKNESA